MAKGNGILRYLRELCFPPHCVSCRELLRWREPRDCFLEEAPALCPTCERQWESEELETCGICAKRVTECRCAPSLMQKAGCASLCKLVYYSPHKTTPVQNRLIYFMKRNHNDRTAHFVAARLLPAVEALLQASDVAREDVVLTYLPRGRRTALMNGTDQAKLLAQSLARESGLTMRPLIDRQRGSGRAQKQLSAEARLENAKRSFCAAPSADCRGKTVLLVDDIVTTGSSMSVCARLLYRMGAARVCGVVIAADETNREPRMSNIGKS